MVAVNVAVFVVLRLIAIVMRFGYDGNSIDPVLDILMLSPQPAQLAVRPWTLLTYMFVQYDPLHLLLNMLWLWMFASVIRREAGGRRLWLLYLAGGIAGGSGYLLSAGGNGLVGSSAAVLAIMGAAMVMRPNVKFNLFLFGEASLKIVGLIAILLVIIATDFGDYGTHMAHGCGLAAGLILGVVYKRKSARTIPVIIQKVSPAPGRPITVKEESKPDLDGLLDKIRRSGYASLTPSEREQLFKISSDLQKRNQ